MAYWTFADPGAVNGGFLPGNGTRADLNTSGAMDTNDFRIGSTDLSGNGNHLTALTSSWMKWSSDSYQGNFGMTANGSFPAAGTDSKYNPNITGTDAEITEGLSEGDQVVTLGKNALREGARLQIVGAPAP